MDNNNLKGLKFDAGKVRMDLVSAIAFTEIAKVYTMGASKYGPNNWRKGILFSRLIGAAFRHLFAYQIGEKIDPESGLSHLAHAAANITFMLEFEVTRPELDDLYKLSSNAPENTSDQVLANTTVQTVK